MVGRTQTPPLEKYESILRVSAGDFDVEEAKTLLMGIGVIAAAGCHRLISLDWG
jgi:hypothetical protein